ncbi:MAG: hypothetical protein ACOCYG_08245 [Spirochaetota bacterium]
MMLRRSETNRRPRIVSIGLVILWILLLPAAAAGQETPNGPDDDDAPQAGPEIPEETEIKLPETLLQVEDLAVEEITAELPESPDVPIRPIEVPLPEEEDLRIVQSAFALPEPTEHAEVAAPEDRSSYFASGVLSAGSMSHIEGALSLSKLGSDPRLRFQFSHDGLDGYGFRDPGTGFFQSRTYIDGYVAGALGPVNAEGSASFQEREEGLQNNPNYFSTDLRFVDARFRGTYEPSDRVELGAALDGRVANRLLTIKAADTQPPRTTEFSVRPSLTGDVSIQDVSLSADLWYQYRGYTRNLGDGHALSLVLAGDAPVTSELFVGGDVGVYWPISGSVKVPFHVTVTATVEDLVTLGLSAGYEAGSQSLYDLWQERPLLVDAAAGEAPPADRNAWVADADLSWNVLSRRLIVSGGVGFEYDEAALSPQEYDEDKGVFPVTQGARTTVRPSVGVMYRAGVFSSELSWSGSFVERSPFEPLHEIDLVLDVATEDRGIAGSLEARSPFFEGQALLPVIRGEVGFRVVEGLRILATVDDPLAPIFESGRPRNGPEVADAYPFIAPGFRFAVSTEISL